MIGTHDGKRLQAHKVILQVSKLKKSPAEKVAIANTRLRKDALSATVSNSEDFRKQLHRARKYGKSRAAAARLARKRRRDGCAENAEQMFSGRLLALTALQRLVVAKLIVPKVYVDDDYLTTSTETTRTHLPIKVFESAGGLYQDKFGDVAFNHKVSLICTVEYMRNSHRAEKLIDCFKASNFDSRTAVSRAFPGEEFWSGVSSTSNLDTMSVRPLHLAAFFDNCMWLIARKPANSPVSAELLREIALVTTACNLLLPHFALALHGAGCLQEGALQAVEKEVGKDVKTGTNTTAYFSKSPSSADVILAEARQVMDAAIVKLTPAGREIFASVSSLKKAFKNKLNVYIWSSQSLIIATNASLLRAAFADPKDIVPKKVQGWSHWRSK